MGRRTIADFERGYSVPNDDTLESIRLAVSKAGVEFERREDGALGVWLKSEARTRLVVSRRS